MTIKCARKWGLPYIGSKSKIAEDILKHIPNADTFVELFAGGGALTHCAIATGRTFKKYVLCEKNLGIAKALAAVIKDPDGILNIDNVRYISKSEYYDIRNNADKYNGRSCLALLLYSFGTDAQTYVCSSVKEPLLREALSNYTLEEAAEHNKTARIIALRLDSIKKMARCFKEHPNVVVSVICSDSVKDALDFGDNCVIYADPPYEGEHSHYKCHNVGSIKTFLENYKLGKNSSIYVSEHNDYTLRDYTKIWCKHIKYTISATEPPKDTTEILLTKHSS